MDIQARSRAAGRHDIEALRTYGGGGGEEVKRRASAPVPALRHQGTAETGTETQAQEQTQTQSDTETETPTQAQRDWAWHRLLKPQNLLFNDRPPLRRPHLLIISKGFHSLRSKHSNTGIYRGHSHSNHHTIQKTNYSS